MISIAAHNAHLQRKPQDQEGHCPTCAQQLPDHPGIIVDTAGGTILRNGHLVSLTVREMEVFQAVYRHRPHVVSIERIIIQIMDEDCQIDESNLEQILVRVNRKIRPIAIELSNVWARGYRAVVSSL